MDSLFHLNPALALAVLQAILLFLLKSSLCFAAIALLVRLTGSPGRRFALWLAYLLGTAAYAAIVVVGLSLHALHTPLPAIPHAEHSAWSSHALAQPALILPAAFASHLSFAVCAIALLYVAFVPASFLLHRQRQNRLRKALLYAFDPSAEMVALADTLATSLRVTGSRVLVLPGLISPATIGWLKPLILLPSLFDEQTRENHHAQLHAQAADILLHELHHIRRRDWLIDHAAYAIRTLLFFQPALWIACRQLRQEREFACDQAVIGDQPERRARYAESLVRFARVSSLTGGTRASASGVDFAATPGQLYTRVNAILTPPEASQGPRAAVALRSAARTGVLLGIVFILFGLTLTLALPVALRAAAPLTSSLAVSQPAQHLSAHLRTHAFHLQETQPSRPVQENRPAATQPFPLLLAGSSTVSEPSHQTHFKLEPAADTEDEPLPDSATQASGSNPAIMNRSLGSSSSDLGAGRIPFTSGGHSTTPTNSSILHVPTSRGHH